ncbi:MAG TPA: type II toxin-antitoxin system VapC family toxin [Pseudonocardiaceae bacterium]|nr:type II toxin-antitoxin system VapC family toxin [Pseudonocardiaceae bacterium]
MTRVLLDTSVVIDPPAELPGVTMSFVSSVTLGELAAGVHTARTATERARRLSRLQSLENMIETLPFGGAAARAYGELYALVIDAGRNPRPRRFDLQIAATAVAHGLILVTRNPDDFVGLDSLVQVIAP